MNTEKAQTLLNKLSEQGASALDELPAVANEVILAGRIIHTGFSVMLIAGVVAAFYLRKYYHRRVDDYDARIGCSLLCGLLGFICLILLLFEVSSAAKAWFAPRAYLVEWISDQI